MTQMACRLKDLEREIFKAEKGREESDERLMLLEKLQGEKEKRDKMLVRLKDFAENDPAVLEQMVKETGEAVEAVNRWTDNIFSIQGWIKKKFPSVDQVDVFNLTEFSFMVDSTSGGFVKAVWYS